MKIHVLKNEKKLKELEQDKHPKAKNNEPEREIMLIEKQKVF